MPSANHPDNPHGGRPRFGPRDGPWAGQDDDRLLQHLFNTIEHSYDGSAIIDAERVVRYWSAGAERIFGYTAEEILGKKVDVLLPPHLIVSGELARIDRVIAETGRLLRRRTLRLAKDGTPVVIELTAAPILDSSGQLIGRTALFRDLTESRRIERQLRQSQRLATVAQLVTGLAHEIGTPLNIISGRAELMSMTLPPGDPNRQELQIIMDESERVAGLIRTLLQFARGGQQTRRRQCSINSIVREVIGLVNRQLKVAGVAIHTDLAHHLPLIDVNRTQVVEVLLNLVVNAWHAMPKGGNLGFATRAIERRDGPWVELRVSDTGHGIASEHYEKVFNPFFSTKAPGKGTGLGLTVVLNIIEQHAGLIEFDSTVGQGTTFTVLLPVERPAQRQ